MPQSFRNAALIMRVCCCVGLKTAMVTWSAVPFSTRVLLSGLQCVDVNLLTVQVLGLCVRYFLGTALTLLIRPSVPASGLHKCLRFGLWLTLHTIICTLYLLIYLTPQWRWVSVAGGM